MSIKNVAVIGGGGNLGKEVVKTLLDGGFNVTVLSRPDSKSTFPSGVSVHKTDYSSSSSLDEAFKGQDAVVSTIASAAIATQQSIVSAAAKAGVKRYIPSEFGINTQNLTGGIAKILGAKTALQDHLSKTASENPEFSWTGVSTGLFFDWGLKNGFIGFSIPNKSAKIWDSGNEPFSGTTLHTIGLAIVSILQHPNTTANKYLNIASFVVTQNEILKAFEEESGSKWSVEKQSTAESKKIADEKLSKGDKSAFGDYLRPHLLADNEGKSPKVSELANEQLGLPKEDLRATIKGLLA